MPIPAIQRCFAEWHDANADRFLVPVLRGDLTERSLRLDFPALGLEDTLYAALRESEITVYTAVGGEVWYRLVSLDLVVPERAAGGGWVWRRQHSFNGRPRWSRTRKCAVARRRAASEGAPFLVLGIRRGGAPRATPARSARRRRA